MSGFLLDTQILVWLQTGDPRLPKAAREQLLETASNLRVSAVTAWEYSDLLQRGRLPIDGGLNDLVEAYDLVLLDLPAGLWTLAQQLPELHRDPLDRMMIAHALHADLTLVSADETVRRYPVRCLW